MNTIDELKEKKMWVCYDLKKENDIYINVPYSAVTNKKANLFNPQELETFENCKSYAKEKGFAGVGIVLKDDLCCIELENSIIDGQLTLDATVLICQFDSYTIKNHSETGHLIFINCKEKFEKKRSVNGENPIIIHTDGEFIVFNDKVINNGTISDKTCKLKEIYNNLFTKNNFYEKIKKNEQNYKIFQILNSGDISIYKYNQEEADITFFKIVSKYCVEYNEVEEIFLASSMDTSRYRNSVTYQNDLYKKVERTLIENKKKAIKEKENYEILNDEIVCLLLRDQYDIFLFNRSEQMYYFFNGKYYEKDINGVFQQKISKVINNVASTSTWSDKSIKRLKEKYLSSSGMKGVEEYYKNLPGISITNEKFNPNKNLICCKNGVVNLINGELLPFDKKYLMIHYIDINYNKYAKFEGSQFEAFQLNCFENDKEKMEYIRVLVGYFLTGETSDQSFYYIKGYPSTGKSVFAKLIRFISGTQVDALSPKCLHIDSNEYLKEMAKAADKRLLIAPEESSRSLLDASAVKSLTGEDCINARDIFKRSFSYCPQFKILTITNEMPQMDSDDDAMIRRFKCIPFNHVVKDGSGKNPHLYEELIKNEAENMLNWAISGAITYYENNRLPEYKFLNEMVTEVFEEQDKLFEWIEECCEKDANSFHTTLELFTSYTNFCSNNKIIAEFKTLHLFSRYLTQKSYVTKTQGGENNHRGYRGLKLK